MESTRQYTKRMLCLPRRLVGLSRRHLQNTERTATKQQHHYPLSNSPIWHASCFLYGIQFTERALLFSKQVHTHSANGLKCSVGQNEKAAGTFCANINKTRCRISKTQTPQAPLTSPGQNMKTGCTFPAIGWRKEIII